MKKDKYTLPQPVPGSKMTYDEMNAKNANETNGSSFVQLSSPKMVTRSLNQNVQLNRASFAPSIIMPNSPTKPDQSAPPSSVQPTEPPSPVKRDLIEPEDDTKSALKEMFLPVMLSGFGNMGAGMVLERVQFWNIFMAVPQLIQLVPPLLGLKGNVEMTLASRLSTHANLGHLADKSTRRQIIIGNIALCQFLATGVGFIAPLIALFLSYFQLSGNTDTVQPPVNDHTSAKSLLTSSAYSMVHFDIENHSSDLAALTWAKGLLVVAIFLATSGLADVILSSTITGVVIVCSQYLRVNADNVATPIAASVGDLLTMCFLVYVSQGLYNLALIASWTPIIPLLLWTIIVIFTGICARRNPFTRSIVFRGWCPLVVAMLLQNISGVVMETSLRRFPKMAVYQPIINGFGGNLVAIQSSRVATYLHKHAPKRELVNESDACCHSPLFFFFRKGQHGKLAFLMVLLAGPLQLPLVLLSTILSPTSQITFAQLTTYYACATFQVIIILYIGYCFVNLLWLFGANPDDNAIPILTALADLLGTIILASGYMFLDSIGDINASPSDDSMPNARSIPEIVYNATASLITNATLDYGKSSITTSTLSPVSSSSKSSIVLTTVASILSTTLAPSMENNRFTSSLMSNLSTTISPHSTNITF